jgi:hypothetical protein
MFYRDPGCAGGYRTQCKMCEAERNREWYQRNKAKTVARVQEWRECNRERYLEYQREYNSAEARKRRDREGHLKRKHGITIADYDAMLAAQDDGCAICHRAPRPDISLHVDHDHETGAIRGLLCFSCNNLLGDVHDDVSLLLAAAEYVWAHQHPELVSTDSR